MVVEEEVGYCNLVVVAFCLTYIFRVVLCWIGSLGIVKKQIEIQMG